MTSMLLIGVLLGCGIGGTTYVVFARHELGQGEIAAVLCGSSLGGLIASFNVTSLSGATVALCALSGFFGATLVQRIVERCEHG